MAQEPNKTSKTLKPVNCEVAQVILSNNHVASKKSNLIIISRLGDGEYKEKLHIQRLKPVRDYLEKSLKRAPETIITARGDRVSGAGRLEIYVHGELYDFLIGEKNKPIQIACKYLD